MSSGPRIMPATESDLDYVRETLRKHWISCTVWSRDVPFEAERLPAFVAWMEDARVGLTTYAMGAGECEVITLSSDRQGLGIGTALLAAVRDAAARAGCRRVFLTTSNDNIHALRFYQKLGWRIVAIYPGAIDRSRQREKAIPLVGPSGIESHDEIELELRL
jgi:GNAT superfamily N-acetyltransferase